jgi:hypothetical protein
LAGAVSYLESVFGSSPLYVHICGRPAPAIALLKAILLIKW